MTADAQSPDRIAWADLPSRVQEAVQARLGTKVVGVTVPAGGFSHGMAALLELADRRTVFAKAIRGDDGLAKPYRIEAETAARLSAEVPSSRMLFAFETESWLVMVFEAVAGRHPRLDRPDELAAVLRTVECLARVLTPSPFDAPTFVDALGPVLTGWRTFTQQGPPEDLDGWALHNLERLAALESTWPATAAGNTLLHSDLRPDNMLLRPDGSVVVVDWAFPHRGSAWLDLVSLVPAMLAAGVDPEPTLTTHPLSADVDPTVVDGFVCALAGYWARNSRLPPIARSPGLRIHQARKAQHSTDWLRRRLGWRQ